MSVHPPSTGSRSLDALLDAAVAAVAEVDEDMLRNRVVDDDDEPAVDDVEPAPPTTDELRRLTILFSDLVGSTALSGELDPETYRTAIGAYMDACRAAIEEFDGHIIHTRGDGVLAVFGHPVAHDDDADRAVRTGLRILDLLRNAPTVDGVPLEARVGVHRGLVYVEQETGEPYGLAVNVAARVQEATPTGTVALSEEVRTLLGDDVCTEPLEAKPMKGVAEVPDLHVVTAADLEVERPRRRWTSPLVGRQAALDRVLGRVAEARTADRPLTLGFVGDAGIGKSRLVDAALHAVDDGLTVVRLEGSPRRQTGLAPVRMLLRRWAGMTTDMTGAEELARLRSILADTPLEPHLALLAPVAGIAPSAGYEPVSADQRLLQAQILDAVHQLLRHHTAVDGDGPTILVVEDLHWVDDLTVQALQRFVAEGPGGVLVVLTSRESIALDDYTVVERVGPLTDDEVAALVEHLAPGTPGDVVGQIVAHADGVPLFVEELVHARLAQELLVGVEPDSAIPPALYDSLYARLGALGDERLVISAAATLGRTVELDVLAAVADQPPELLDQAVATLIEHRVFDPHHGDGRVVRFRHELVRQVAYELEPPSGRRRLHALAARELAKQGGAVDWSRIAGHRHESGDPWGAVHDLRLAADDARRRGAIEEARSLFDRALDVLAEAPRDARRDRREVAIRLDRAFLAVSSDGFASEHAAEDYARCLELAIAHPESDELYRTLVALWGYCLNRSDLDGAWKLSEAVRGLTIADRAHLLPTNMAGFGMIRWYRGDFDDAVARLRDGVAVISDVGLDEVSLPSDWTMPLDPLASMHIHYALARFWVGDVAGADESFWLARQRCTALPFPVGPFTDVYCLLLGTWIDAERDDLDAALAKAAEAAAISERHGFEAWAMWSITASTALGALADPTDDEIMTHVEQVEAYLELWHAIGVHVLSGSIHSVLARALLASGRTEQALALTDIGIAWAAESGSVPFVADLKRVRALAGAEADCVRELAEALRLANEQGAVVSAVRIAGDLVRIGGESHQPALDDALSRVPPGVRLPVVDSARSLLLAR